MPAVPENLELLHTHEEQLRAESLGAIAADKALSDHLQMVHDALDYLTVLQQAPSTPGDDTHTLQLLGIRLFNTGATALKLGLSGYYQGAFIAMRDCFELVNLIDLFRSDNSQIARWKAADKQRLRKEFSPAAVRNALAACPAYAGQNRQKIYGVFSGHATHVTYSGFQLIAPGNEPKLGPFFHLKFLRALLEEMGRHLAHAASAIGTMFDADGSLTALAAKAHFLAQLGQYHENYIKPKPAT